MTGPMPLSWWDLAAAALLVALNGGLSLWLGLGLERRLVVASLRALVQLTLLGFVLVPVFALGHPALVVGIGLVMVALAAREAVGRTQHRWRGGLGTTFVALLVGCGATAVIGTAGIVGAEPWYTPQYAIPMLGMLLGNSLTGVSLGLDRTLSALTERRGLVEARLALGATWWEAARPVAADSARIAMIPILNSMSAAGLVTIPGMMTGQILGGTDPVLASRYQIVILFLIAASVALGAGGAILAALFAMFDAEHRLRAERIRTVAG